MSLTASDPFGPGAPDEVQITAITATTYVTLEIQQANALILGRRLRAARRARRRWRRPRPGHDVRRAGADGLVHVFSNAPPATAA